CHGSFFTSPIGRGRIALAIRVRGLGLSMEHNPSPGAARRPLPMGEVKEARFHSTTCSLSDASQSSRQRKAQRLAAARHVDRGKTGGGKAAGATVALFSGLELVLARAKLFCAGPVQRLVLELYGAVIGIDGLGERKNLFGLAGDVGMQAFAGI